uniref:Sushi domain-containing protein n=1 Tax=Onchocerca volvulus TaxID=6282 RepID=A0A044U769_ONCVO
MLIRSEYLHVFILPLFTTTAIVTTPTCEDIITTSNGNVIYMEANYEAKHSPGTAALMACKFGYVSSLPYLVFCQANGTWNYKLGECILTSKTCSPQNTESNVVYMPPEISDIYPSGTFAMLHCSIGQLPVGPSSAVCLNGEWNVELGYCKELHSDGIFSGPSQRRDISISDFKTGSETVSAEDKAITYAMPTETENASLSAVVSESIFDEWSTILNETVEDTAPLDLMKMEKLSDESFAITISSILPSD